MTEKRNVILRRPWHFSSRPAYWRGLGIALVCVAAIGQYGLGQNQGGGRQELTARLLQGRIMNRSSQPIAHAVVFLKNTKTLTVKTFIASPEGTYRFPALSPNVDYEVYAEHNGKRSNVKTLSAFDGRREPRIDLKINE